MKQHFGRREVLSHAAALSLAASLGIAAPATARARQSAAPNILFIMADDLGYADLGCYGRRDYTTPVLDALAAQGAMLTQGYANSPVCSATRTALITGAYQYRLPVGLAEPLAATPALGLSPAVPTLPRLLKKLGYSTSLIGKWHLGQLPSFGPLKSGYDKFFGIHDGGVDYFTHTLFVNNQELGGLYEGERPVERQGYLTDLLAERAVAEIKAAASADAPFFMSLHFTAPHWPWEAPEDGAPATARRDSQHWDGGNLRTYAKMVQSLDRNIGRVLQALEAAGLASNTIVVFTSDNGGERFSDNWPFTGSKTELLEGGIRVPLLIRWPGRIKPRVIEDQVMISMDFLPTLVAAAGSKLDASAVVDGANLHDVLTGRSASQPRTLFWRYKARDQHAIRVGDWKYLKIQDREYLFNLAQDQRERANLKDVDATRFARLKLEFAEWNRTMLPYPPDGYSHSISTNLPDR